MTYKLRPCFSSYFLFLILGMIGGAFIAYPIAFFINIFEEGFADQYILYMWLPFILLIVIYLSFYQIVIENDVLIIPNSLFDHRKTVVTIKDIKKLNVQIGVGNKNKKSFYTLWLKYRNGKAQINIKTFSISGLEEFMKLLYDSNSSVELDKYCQSMYSGAFKEAITKGFYTYIKPSKEIDVPKAEEMNIIKQLKNSLNIDNGFLEVISEVFDEDIAIARLDNGTIIDFGYIETERKFYLTVVENDNWRVPLEVVEFDNVNELLKTFQSLIYKYQ